MGRLIEADEVNEAIYKSFEDIQCYDGTGYDIYSDSKKIIDKIPTVEAIPKADYEARLKADMIAILTEIKLKIAEKSYCDTTVIGDYEDEVRINLVELDDVNEIIIEKINALKGQK